MHKHEFMFTYEGNAVCTDPTCAYRFSLKEVKEILSNIANGESVQHSAQSDLPIGCPECGALPKIEHSISCSRA